MINGSESTGGLSDSILNSSLQDLKPIFPRNF